MFVYVCFRDGCTCRERRGGGKGERGGQGKGNRGGGGKGSGVGILCRIDLYVYDVFMCLVFVVLSRRDVGVHVERGGRGKGRRGEGEEGRRRGKGVG